MQAARAIDHITDWLRSYCERSGQQGFVVGVSGGIDSALTSALCARTGLPTLCVEMPIHQALSQVERAQEHIAWLTQRHPNVRMEVVRLTSVFDNLMAALPRFEDRAVMELALANARACA